MISEKIHKKVLDNNSEKINYNTKREFYIYHSFIFHDALILPFHFFLLGTPEPITSSFFFPSLATK